VLSFPQQDPEQPDKSFKEEPKDAPALPRQLGDIVVCFPEAVKEAQKLGRMVDDQICFLVEHGLMHLLGYHHD
jgi:probable rRNA maturation factor